MKHQKSVQCDRALMTCLEKSNNSFCKNSGLKQDYFGVLGNRAEKTLIYWLIWLLQHFKSFDQLKEVFNTTGHTEYLKVTNIKHTVNIINIL